MDRLAGKKADSVRLPNLQLLCAGKLLDHAAAPSMTLQQLHDSIWKPHCAAGDGSSGAGQGPAAAATAAGDGSNREQGVAGDRVMMIYYSA